jgi:hypothetical protein
MRSMQLIHIHWTCESSVAHPFLPRTEASYSQVGSSRRILRSKEAASDAAAQQRRGSKVQMEPRIEDITSNFAESIVDSKVKQKTPGAAAAVLCQTRHYAHSICLQAALPASFDLQWRPVRVQGQWRARGGVASCCLSASTALFFGGGSRDGGVFNDVLLVDAATSTGNLIPNRAAASACQPSPPLLLLLVPLLPSGRVIEANGPSPSARSGELRCVCCKCLYRCYYAIADVVRRRCCACSCDRQRSAAARWR